VSSGPRVEVAEIIRRHAEDYRRFRGGRLSPAEQKVLGALAACRTPVLGGHIAQCDARGHQRVKYHSCGNRHCPKCRASARAAWLDARAAELLPVAYYHVVFTLPEQLAPLALQNKRLAYEILFQAAAETLQQLAADPRHLGAEIGFLAVLHTWGQDLRHHPHLHCVVPGGGLALDGGRWIACREGFFLPVRVLSRVFRGKFLDRLRQAYGEGKLSFHGKLAGLSQPQQFRRLLSACYEIDWVVYAKPPFGGPEQVLKYLARYTHRVAISNRRLVALADGQVSFRWKNYARGNRTRTMTLSAVEFLRRFLLHILPSGFVRIRHYGFLANRHRATKLAFLRELLGAPPPKTESPSDPASLPEATSEPEPVADCPKCQAGHMRLVQELARPSLRQLAEIPWLWDTS
jgi:hypothetical protein